MKLLPNDFRSVGLAEDGCYSPSYRIEIVPAYCNCSSNCLPNYTRYSFVKTSYVDRHLKRVKRVLHHCIRICTKRKIVSIAICAVMSAELRGLVF